MSTSNLARWERLAAISGIAFVVLLVAGIALSGSVGEPNVDDLSQVKAYYADRGAQAFLLERLWVLAVLFLLPFLASLWQALRRAEAQTGWLSALALAAGVASALLLLAGVAFIGTAFHIIGCTISPSPDECGVGGQGFDPRIYRALTDISFSFLTTALSTLAVFFSATALVAIKRGGLPRWLGWVSAVSAVLFLLAGFMKNPIVYPLFLVWVVAASVVLFRRTGMNQI